MIFRLIPCYYNPFMLGQHWQIMRLLDEAKETVLSETTYKSVFFYDKINDKLKNDFRK